MSYIDSERFTPFYSIESAGHTIGLLQCKLCGSVVIIGDEDFDGPEAHVRFHEAK